MNDLLVGIRRHRWRFLGQAFLAFSVLWTSTECLSYFVPGFDVKGIFPLAGILLISLFWASFQVWKPSKVEIKVAHTNTTLEVLFGDLFEQDGYRAIAVNEFFDSELGKPVSDTSLHGLFLKKCFGGHPEPFDKQVDEQLANVERTEVEKSAGKKIRYPIGSCAMVTVDDDRYLCFALCKTDPDDCKASADVSMLWDALHYLWQCARVETGGRSLNLPLVGSGLSGIGLPTRDLLNLIVLSVITETKQNQITPRIRVVLTRDRFDDIDLREVKQYWGVK